jgi:mRNA interferase MazF
MVRSAYVPEPGHLIKVDFDPRTGHEQGGWRPAIVLSPLTYNRATGLAIVAPITNQQKGYPFEVALPAGLKVSGVVLSDALKNVDWRARNARFVETVPLSVLAAVKQRIGILLGFED